MTEQTPNPSTAPFSAEPWLPQDPAFYKRVMDRWPSPLLVVDGLGQIVYLNAAGVALGALDLEKSVGKSMLDYVHPDDAESLTEAFLTIASDEESLSFDEGGDWATVHFRLVSEDGRTIPIEVVGAGGLQDPIVNGIIYDVRPAYEQTILRAVLRDLAAKRKPDAILRRVAEMVALPPLDLDAALVEPLPDGSWRVVGATDARLHDVLANASGEVPWADATSEPTMTELADVNTPVGRALREAGFIDLWHLTPEAVGTAGAYRIVAAANVFHRPSAGAVDRLMRASELAAVVLLRTRTDDELEHAATHDRLTHLPNREGFHRLFDDLRSHGPAPAAVLFLDLDGFKEINDEHGHAAGDVVLEVVASRLASNSRVVDLIARLGGDEFVLVLGDRDGSGVSQQQALDVADRLLEQINQPIDLGAEAVGVSASIGVSLAQEPGRTAEQMLAAADATMYKVKQSPGRQPLASFV